VTALARLFRTTAFKLALALLAVFAVTTVLALGYVVWHSNRLIEQQISEAVDSEAAIFNEEYRASGIRGLAELMDRRARQPGSLLYLLTTPNGQPLAGNVAALPAGILEKPAARETFYARLGEGDNGAARAYVRSDVLPGGFRLLIGRDLAERGRVTAVLTRAILGGVAIVVLLGLTGGILVSQRVLVRIDDMTANGRVIMAGDLSGRLPVTGSGDEFDRLAISTNAMLDRIGVLMTELREVSDNVAHDLKTPLTRLRNHAEEALRATQTEQGYRTALERVIEEADSLIGVFNAMLMIARAESGAVHQSMEKLDAEELVRDVAELYEPVAEDNGVVLDVETVPGLTIHGNRELLGQALANLVDNALKHGLSAPGPDGGRGTITLTARAGGPFYTRLTVADRGAGIPEADRARALERFVRLEPSRSQPGSGLGLSLAEAIVRQHGGILRLEDNAPGLRVEMDLPVEPLPAVGGAT